MITRAGSVFSAFSAWQKSWSCPKLQTQPPLPSSNPLKISKENKESASLYDTILHYFVWKCYCSWPPKTITKYWVKCLKNASSQVLRTVFEQFFRGWESTPTNPQPTCHLNNFCRLNDLSGPILRDIAILSLRCPISRDTASSKVSCPPKWCDTCPLVLRLVSHRDICAIPNFATYHAIIVRYPPPPTPSKKQALNVLRYHR